MSDLLFQNISTVQNQGQPQPPTIAVAATIAPTTRLTFITGTTSVATITPPVTGHHQLVLIFTDASPGAFVTTGNIAVATTPVQNKPVYMEYNPVTAKYYPARTA